jgi:superfamily II DNA or RNA helicase
MEKLRQLDKLRAAGSDTEANALEAELHIIRSMLRSSETPTSNTDYKPYPDVEDPNFFTRLLAKKEVYEHTYSPANDDGDFDTIADQQCHKATFELTNNQKFLKRFMSPRTPYNSVLLFHGVGVGKTCSSISIAEQFLAQTRRRKVLVLLPSALLKDNYKRQIFDSDTDPSKQCVAETYTSTIPGRHLLTKTAIERRVARQISERYKFMGFIEFANSVERMRKDAVVDAGPTASDSVVEARLSQRLRAAYSNLVIIIDEVHNLRLDSEATKKRVPPILEKVLKAARNVKLVLMTATPMFNDPREIVYIANLILHNEKKQPLRIGTIFNKDGTFRTGGEEQLRTALRGCVSYMRGENPYTFPTRLYPSINKDKNVLRTMPKVDIRGNTIPSSQILQGVEIVGCEIKGAQLKAYKEADAAFSGASPTSSASSKSSVSPASAEGEESFELQLCIQVSNIVYPVSTHYRSNYGENGFWGCFQRVRTGQKAIGLRVTYKSGYEGLLAQPRLSDVSAKIAAVVHYVSRCNGIAFVYSNWKWSGVIPLAIALEHAGFAKYGGANILNSPGSGSGKMGSYVIISGDKDISPDNDAEVRLVRSTANANGSIVRVVLATSVATEGVDFKGIRELHLLEPWFHMKKVEQIIGRAARHCSHIGLDAKQRNVTIYHHASVIPGQKRETLDLRLYRISMNKQVRIQHIEKMLQNNAVDCALNKELHHQGEGVKRDMLTSQGTVVKQYALHNAYTPQCMATIPNERDTSTFSPRDYDDEVRRYQVCIVNLFKKVWSATFTDILEAVEQQLVNKPLQEIVSITLQHMIDNRVLLTDANSQIGYIIYASNMYIFQPVIKQSARISLAERKLVAQQVQVGIPLGLTNAPATVTASQMITADDDHTDVRQTFLQRIKDMKRVLSDPSTDSFQEHIQDMVVDRLSIDEFLAMCAIVMPTPPSNDEAAQVFSKSLQRGHMVALDSRGGIKFVAVPHNESIWYARRPQGDISPISDLEQREEQDILQAAIPLGTLPPSPPGLKAYTAYVTPPTGGSGEQGVPARFKVVGEGTNSKGFVCEQTATLKVDPLRDLVGHANANVLGMVTNAAEKRGRGAKGPDKKDLCMAYELALRAAGRCARPHMYNLVSAQDTPPGKAKTRRKSRRIARF